MNREEANSFCKSMFTNNPLITNAEWVRFLDQKYRKEVD